ncbi:hypothetical protein [Aeribacillus composti]|uniref:hypothetical protein n=1 Tax=Aeribacillus composti TaxID=1868734 RepID=UPI0009ED28FB|nr:hypothetical protein [Aeribacillus composti]
MSLIVFPIVKTEETAEKIFLIMSHCSAGSATSKASSNKRRVVPTHPTSSKRLAEEGTSDK